MTTQQTQARATAHEPHPTSPSSKEQIESHTHTSPRSFDEGSVFTRAALQTTQLLELPAELRRRLMGEHGEKQPPVPAAEDNPYRGNTVLLDGSAVEQALQDERSLHPVEPTRTALDELDPTATLYDGGALRQQALKLAAELASATAPEAAPAGARDDAETPAPTPQPKPPGLASKFGALANAWRQASLVRRATALLLPIAALTTLWPDDPAQARSTEPVAVAAPKPAKLPRTPEAATGASSTLSPALSPAHEAKKSGAPADISTPSAKDSFAKEPSDAQQFVEAQPSSDSQRYVEAQALKAAFSGDAPAAARHYERLARAGKDPRFELALHLVRSGAMRRP